MDVRPCPRSSVAKGQIIVQYQGQDVHVKPVDGNLSIGRIPENDLALALPGVSKRHAEIQQTETGLVIVDLNSEKGTFIAGNRLLPGQPYALPVGIPIQIGPFVLTYQMLGGGSSVTTPVEARTPEVETVTIEAEPVPSVPIKPPRDRQPMPLMVGQSNYLQYLPAMFHEHDFIDRFLRIFETIWEPLEWRQNSLEMYFDPRTAPTSMLEWLASWLGLPVAVHYPESRRRALLHEALELYIWRGTNYGLTKFIELSTGFTATISNEPKNPFVIRIKINPPPNETVPLDILEDVIRTHKPAVMGYVIEIVGQTKKKKA
jgi:phage tail-like protein